MKAPRKTVRRPSSVEQRLYEQWREFVERSHAALDKEDDLALEAITQKFRDQVRKAAASGVETSITWYSLGMWTWDNDDRIVCFGRALRCLAKEVKNPATDALGQWTYVHYHALCRFEIARALAAEGRPADAIAFLEDALPYARTAEDMPVHGDELEGNLEGRIAGELMLLAA